MDESNYKCTILADSISVRGHRLTTFELTYPRIILPEMLTHRVFSRNTSSSRAIPVWKQIRDVSERPFVPEAFGVNEKGMVAHNLLDDEDQGVARDIWQTACANAIEAANQLDTIEVHKQLANRVLEPYAWITQIVTSTDWHNFFDLRLSEEAQPEIRKIAQMMRVAYDTSSPKLLIEGEWHVPMLSESEYTSMIFNNSWDYWTKVSVGRCARVSYLTHDGKRDSAKDIELYDRLKDSKHFSPFEHVARPFTEKESEIAHSILVKASQDYIYNPFLRHVTGNLWRVGNLTGWINKRMEIEYGM